MPRHLKNQFIIVALIIALFFVAGAVKRYREINRAPAHSMDADGTRINPK
jgi:hypothetical protein